MKILIASDIHQLRSGGIKSFNNLVNKLKLEHYVDIFDKSAIEQKFNKIIFKPGFFLNYMKNYFFLQKSYKYMKNYMSLNKPNMILTQGEYSIPAIKSSKELKIPSVLFIRCTSSLCPIRFSGKDPLSCSKNCFTCIKSNNFITPLHYINFIFQYPFIKNIFNLHNLSNKNADLVISNSKYMAGLLKLKGIKSRILYPIIDLKEYKVNNLKEDQKKYILFVRPEIHKGVDIFMRIAKKMNNENFLAVGNTSNTIKQKINKIKNIKYISWVDDMKNIYSKAKLVIIPSIWPEAFGRVPIEAGINGIPSIGSNIGGLPESINDGGILIDDIYDIDKWIYSINLILNNKNLYQEKSNNAIKNLEKYDVENSYKNLKNIVQEELNINI